MRVVSALAEAGAVKTGADGTDLSALLCLRVVAAKRRCSSGVPVVEGVLEGVAHAGAEERRRARLLLLLLPEIEEQRGRSGRLRIVLLMSAARSKCRNTGQVDGWREFFAQKKRFNAAGQNSNSTRTSSYQLTTDKALNSCREEVDGVACAGRMD